MQRTSVLLQRITGPSDLMKETMVTNGFFNNSSSEYDKSATALRRTKGRCFKSCYRDILFSLCE